MKVIIIKYRSEKGVRKGLLEHEIKSVNDLPNVEKLVRTKAKIEKLGIIIDYFDEKKRSLRRTLVRNKARGMEVLEIIDLTKWEGNLYLEDAVLQSEILKVLIKEFGNRYYLGSERSGRSVYGKVMSTTSLEKYLENLDEKTPLGKTIELKNKILKGIKNISEIYLKNEYIKKRQKEMLDHSLVDLKKLNLTKLLLLEKQEKG